MSEATHEKEAPPAEEPARESEQKVEETDWKAEARKWEQRAKENKTAAERLKELEDAKKSEQERITEQLEAAKAEGSKAQQALVRLDVALEKAPEGMSIAQVRKLAKRLSGSTKEELEADADELFADFAPSKERDNGGRPKERLRPGAAPDAEPELTPEQLAEAVTAKRGY